MRAKWTVATLGMLLIGASAPPARMAAAAGDGPAEIGGVYKHRFQNALVDGTKFQSENILEIVPTGPSTAYFRVHLEFFNGHMCALSGVAHEQGNSLLYDKRLDITDHEGRPEHCRLRIVRQGKILMLDEDESGACRANFCGARGRFSGVSFELSRRRPIRYMTRLRGSQEFQTALKEDADQFAPARAGEGPSAALDVYVRKDLHAAQYKWAEADLNGDGRAEQFIYATDSRYCGSGGCTLFVLQGEASGYRVILRSTVTRLPIRLLATTSHGWRDLAVDIAGGGVPSGTVRLRFGGDKYPGNPTAAPRLPPGSALGPTIMSK